MDTAKVSPEKRICARFEAAKMVWWEKEFISTIQPEMWPVIARSKSTWNSPLKVLEASWEGNRYLRGYFGLAAVVVWIDQPELEYKAWQLDAAGPDKKLAHKVFISPFGSWPAWIFMQRVVVYGKNLVNKYIASALELGGMRDGRWKRLCRRNIW